MTEKTNQINLKKEGLPEVSITIPIYNEEAGIAKTVLNLARTFKSHKVNFELVLINHGSSDNTHIVLEKLAKDNPCIRVFNLAKNLGYGGGIMYGLEHSRGECVGFTCADEEVPAQEVFKVYNSLGKDYDVTKSRRIDRKDGAFRKFTSLVFNTFIQIRFGLGLKDVNGYPIFLKRKIYPLVKAEEKTTLFNLDFLRNIKNKGFKILEVPIIHQKREKGRSFMKLSRIFKMAWDLLKYSLR